MALPADHSATNCRQPMELRDKCRVALLPHAVIAIEPGRRFCEGSAVTAQALFMVLWRTLEGAICDPLDSVRRDWIGSERTHRAAV